MDLIKKEQRVALIFPKEDKLVEVICTVNKIYDDRLELILPQYFMRYLNFLQVGCKLTVKVFSKIGTIDFNTVVIASPLEDSFLIELDYNSMKLNTGAEVSKISAVEKLELKKKDDVLTFKTIEISTSYIKFYADKKLNLEEFYDCNLFLPKGYGIINFKGVISEVDSVYDNEYTLRYSMLDEESVQKILYYMYMYTKDLDW